MVRVSIWRNGAARQRAKEKRAITAATKRLAAKPQPAKQPMKQPDLPRLTVVRNR